MNKILKVMCFILFALFAGINTIYAQGQSPTGLVVDENGQPMIGVQIKIEGTTVGAITDVDGNFTIKAQKGNILIFSYVGYEQQKITYKGEKVLAIKMLPSTEMLEDVVVIGYGKQKKNSVVSSINAIGPKELSVSSSRNMTNNLAGQVPGLIAVQRSGEPGYDNADFWIRGQSSFKGGTNPLVLVDGVPRSLSESCCRHSCLWSRRRKRSYSDYFQTRKFTETQNLLPRRRDYFGTDTPADIYEFHRNFKPVQRSIE